MCFCFILHYDTIIALCASATFGYQSKSCSHSTIFPAAIAVLSANQLQYEKKGGRIYDPQIACVPQLVPHAHDWKSSCYFTRYSPSKPTLITFDVSVDPVHHPTEVLSIVWTTLLSGDVPGRRSHQKLQARQWSTHFGDLHDASCCFRLMGRRKWLQSCMSTVLL